MPSPPQRCAYWMGRCYEMLGDYLDALLLYQRTRGLANHSYYGRLAQDAADASCAEGCRRPGMPAPTRAFRRPCVCSTA